MLVRVFHSRPRTVEAQQLDGTEDCARKVAAQWPEVQAESFLVPGVSATPKHGVWGAFVRTGEPDKYVVAKAGDWIIREKAEGESADAKFLFSVMKPADFDRTFEHIEVLVAELSGL